MSKVISDVKTAIHTVVDAQPVNARAIIGNAQKGSWVMMVNDQRIDGGTGTHWVNLGNGEDLRGRLLEVSAVIQDVRPQTDRLSLAVEVTGPATTTMTIAHNGDPGGAAAYSAIIFFA